MLPCGAPKDEEEGLCGALLPHPLDSTSSTRGYPLRRGNVGCRGLCQYRIPVSGAGRLSPVPNFIWLSVFGLWSFAFQSGCPACIARFSLLGGMDCLCLRLRWVLPWIFVELPLTAPFLPISWSASPFHQICWVEEYSKTAFVRLKLQENGYHVQPKLLTIQTIPYRYPPKETTQSRSAQILRKTIAKPHVAAGTNDLSPQ